MRPVSLSGCHDTGCLFRFLNGRFRAFSQKFLIAFLMAKHFELGVVVQGLQILESALQGTTQSYDRFLAPAFRGSWPRTVT